MFDGYWIEILPGDYIIDISERGDRSKSMIFVAPNSGEYFLLGVPMFQDYVTHHNMDN